MPIYSHSRLSTYENCPLQFKFHYIDRVELEEGPEGIEAFLGSRFHESMEKLYGDLKFRVMPLEELAAYYDGIWDKNITKDIVINNEKYTAKNYRDMGRKFIENYYKSYQPFNAGKVLAIEKEIIIDLDGNGNYKLKGYIDRIDQLKDSTYEIHDYKTSSRLPEQKYIDQDRQLGLYHLGLENLWNDVKKVDLVWHYVAFDKELRSSRSRKQLEELKKDTIRLIDTIESAKDFPAQESALCGWCDYQDICPKKKHAVIIESLPVKEYKKDDGVKLVGQFLQLKEDKNKLQDSIDIIEQEIEDVKNESINFAKQMGYETIYGKGYKLNIKTKQKVSCPKKGTDEREELEELLKEMDKWDDVSALDTHALGKAILEESWKPEMIKEIKKHVEIETINNVTLSKSDKKEK